MEADVQSGARGARVSPADVPPSATLEKNPSLVVLLGPSVDAPRMNALLSAGTVIVAAPTIDLARTWLPWALQDLPEYPRDMLRFAQLEISLSDREARWKGTSLPLTELELQLLAMLATVPSRVWTFRELSQQVWGTSFYGDSTALRSTVKRLRKKLACHRVDLVIRSVRGVGFVLVVRLPDANLE